MDGDYALLWVLIVVVLGIAASCYSLWKGCKHGYQERGLTPRSLIAPYSSVLQQLRAEEAQRNRLFSISGRSVREKNPPLYDELFAPPPTYEESMRMLRSLTGSTEKCEQYTSSSSSNTNDDKTECDNLNSCVTIDVPHAQEEVHEDDVNETTHVTVIIIETADGVTNVNGSSEDDLDSVVRVEDKEVPIHRCSESTAAATDNDRKNNKPKTNNDEC